MDQMAQALLDANFITKEDKAKVVTSEMREEREFNDLRLDNLVRDLKELESDIGDFCLTSREIDAHLKRLTEIYGTLNTHYKAIIALTPIVTLWLEAKKEEQENAI